MKTIQQQGQRLPLRQDEDVSRDEACDLLHIARFECVQDGLPQESIGLEPPAGACMQLRYCRGACCRQMLAKQVSKQRVIAEPTLLIVEGGEEGVRFLQFGEDLLAVLPA